MYPQVVKSSAVTVKSSDILYIWVFPKFSEFRAKTFVITVKGLEPATPYVRDQDATTASARHMWETGSLNWAQLML